MELKFKIPKLRVVDDTPEVALPAEKPNTSSESIDRRPSLRHGLILSPVIGALLVAVLVAAPLIHHFDCKRTLTVEEILDRMVEHRLAFNTALIRTDLLAVASGKWSEVTKNGSPFVMNSMYESTNGRGVHLLEAMGPGITPELVAHMRKPESDANEYGTCATVLGSFGQQSVQPLLDLLRCYQKDEVDSNGFINYGPQACIQQLGKIGDPSAIALAGMIEGKNPADSELAWRVLGEMILPETDMDPLLGDPFGFNRQVNIRIPASLEGRMLERISQIRQKQRALVEAQKLEWPADEEFVVFGVGSVQFGPNVDYKKIVTIDDFVRQQKVHVALAVLELQRLGLIAGLGHLQSPHASSLASLQSMLEHDKSTSVRVAAAHAVGLMIAFNNGSNSILSAHELEDATAELRKAVSDPENRVRQTALQRLCYIALTNASCRSVIEVAIRQDDSETKYAAVVASMACGPDMVKHLMTQLRQDYEDIGNSSVVDGSKISAHCELLEDISKKYPEIGIPQLLRELSNESPEPVEQFRRGCAAETLFRLRPILGSYRNDIQKLSQIKNKYVAEWATMVVSRPDVDDDGRF